MRVVPVLACGLLGLALVLSGCDDTAAHGLDIRLGRSGDEKPTRMVRSPSGELAVIGSVVGDVDLGHGAMSTIGGEAFVAVYDRLGSLLWVRTIIAARASDVVFDDRGVVTISGDFDERVDLGGGLLPEQAGGVFVAQYGADGTPRWSKTVHGEQDPGRANRLALAADGGVVWLVDVEGEVDVGSGPHTIASSLLASFDRTGAPRWLRDVSAIGIDDQGSRGSGGPRALRLRGGDIDLIGAFAGSVTVGDVTLRPRPTGGGAYIETWSRSGDRAGVRDISLSAVAAGRPLEVAADGSMFVLGTTLDVLDADGTTRWSYQTGFGDEIVHAALAADASVVLVADQSVTRVGPGGVELGNEPLGSTGQVTPRAVVLDGDGSAIVAGSYHRLCYQGCDNAERSPEGYTSADMFVVDVDLED